MGEPACLLDRTCPTCARFLADADVAAGRCPRCGTALTDGDDEPRST